jgi:hypothetical protein
MATTSNAAARPARTSKKGSYSLPSPKRAKCKPAPGFLKFRLRREKPKECAMTVIEARLIEQLKKLPPSRVAEVVDFVEFLASQEERTAAAQRLTEGLARLDALNLSPICEDEVEAEIQAARQEKLQQQGH